MSEDCNKSEQLPGCASAPRKLTWRELQLTVKHTKAVQQGLANRVPHSFTFCDNKLYFLAVPRSSRENTIHYIDIPEGCSGDGAPSHSYDWKPVVDVASKFASFAGFSREEQLLRERKRLGSIGITSYDFDDTQRKFLFSASGGLFTFTDWRDGEDDGSQQTCIPEEIRSQAIESKMDAKLCPSNSDLVAFIHRNDVWVSNMATGESRRLTYTNSGLSNIIEESLSAGVASFIAQEEFDRYTGYWWQPQHATEDDLTRTYKILYEEVDESCVEVLHIVSGPESLKRQSSVDSYRYPRAGSMNSKSKLKLVEFSIDSNGQLCDDVIEHQMRVPLDEVFPGAEYLVRCGWLPTGDSIFVQLLDRSQQHLLMLRIPLTFFAPMTTPITQLQNLPAAVPMVDVLAEESNEVWINVCDIVYFTKGDGERLQFIWSSEISGFRHLYFATVCANHPMTRARAASLVGDSYLRYPVVTQRQLTAGDWEVDGKQIWVDESRKLIYFMGTKDTPLEQHLYVVSFADGRIAEPRRLTEAGYSHIVSMDEDCSRFVTVFSSIKQTHASTVWRVVHDEVEIDSEPLVTVEPVTHLLEPDELPAQYQPPELFSFRSKHGHDIYGFYIKPPNMEPGTKYPCVLFVYGGPHVQLVNNSHKGWRFLRLQTIAMLGYVVVVLDCRGSAHRGLQFEGHLRGRLGMVEIEEQVEGLEYIASVTNFMDESRVAIHGWSYGGYLALHGLIQRPDVFKLAVAGAPVTTWEAYDTGYTERYMGTPQRNPMGYRASSVLTHVNRFPDEENRLLLVHGLIDENVHFYHTSMLISELVKACKPYQLLIYPSERHGIRHSVASEHYETMLLSFFQNNL